MNSSAFVEDDEVVGRLERLRSQCAGKVFSDIVDDEGHQYVDLVMEGGGVLGVALVGYTYVLEQMGIRFLSVGGTSAGAINALLIAAVGKPWEDKSSQIISLLTDLDCHRFVDGGSHIRQFVDELVEDGVNPWLLPSLPWVVDRITHNLGMNPGEAFLDWLSNVLHSFRIKTSRDLKENMNERSKGLHHRERGSLSTEQVHARLAVVATEVVTETKVELPRMACLFWPDPENLDPALFIRASMSIPYFFEPLVIEDIPQGPGPSALWSDMAGLEGDVPTRCVLIDGGVMSNFPIELFHIRDRVPSAPTFGVKLGLRERHNEVRSPLALGRAMLNSARHCLDYDFLCHNPDYRRLVAYIDSGPHEWLNFALTDEQKVDLFRRGAQAAVEFLERFDWDRYKVIRSHIAKTYP